MTRSTDPAPPSNVEAERQLLGAMLLDGECIADVAAAVAAEDFHLDAHAEVFRAIGGARDAGRPVEPLTLADALARGADPGPWRTRLADLMGSAPHAANAAYHARVVREKAVARRLIAACEDTIRDVYANELTADQVAAAAEARIFAIAEAASGPVEVLPGDRILAAGMARVEARSTGEVAGVTTGYRDLDGMLGGCLGNGELAVLAARPSMGKTSLALGICERAVMGLGVPALMVSLEMGHAEIGERLLAGRSRVSGDLLRRAHLMDPSDWAALRRAAREMGSPPLYLDDAPTRTMAQIASLARRERARRRIELLVVDYLQLIDGTGDGDRGASRQEVVSKISRRLKTLAKELGIPVLALSQLNRQSEGRTDRRPLMSDLRESGAIEQDADVVMLLHRPEYYDPNDKPGIAEVIVAKNRNGATGVVELAFLKHLARFEDCHHSDRN